MGEIIKTVPSVEELEEEKFGEHFGVGLTSRVGKEGIEGVLAGLTEIDRYQVTPVEISQAFPLDGEQPGQGGRMMANAELQLVVFRLGDEEYGVDILQVQEIIRMMDITRVPKAPAFVEGVINLRGQIIPVIDLRIRFGLPEGERTNDSRIVVVNVEEVTVGMIVDAVLGVISMPREAVSPASSVVTGVKASFLEGIGQVDERLLIIIDLARVLDWQEVDGL